MCSHRAWINSRIGMCPQTSACAMAAHSSSDRWKPIVGKKSSRFIVQSSRLTFKIPASVVQFVVRPAGSTICTAAKTVRGNNALVKNRRAASNDRSSGKSLALPYVPLPRRMSVVARNLHIVRRELFRCAANVCSRGGPVANAATRCVHRSCRRFTTPPLTATRRAFPATTRRTLPTAQTRRPR